VPSSANTSRSASVFRPGLSRGRSGGAGSIFGEYGAASGNGEGAGGRGGEVPLWLPSRRLIRSLMAMAFCWLSTLQGLDVRRNSATLPSNCSFGHLDWATRSGHQSFANLGLSQSEASVYQTAVRLT